LAALTIAKFRGQAAKHLPGRAARLELPRRWAQRCWGCWWRPAPRRAFWSWSRLIDLACAAKRSWSAATAALMAIVVVVPIPSGIVLPALELMLVGLGLFFRDGVVMPRGRSAAALGLAITAFQMSMAWVWGGEWMARWISILSVGPACFQVTAVVASCTHRSPSGPYLVERGARKRCHAMRAANRTSGFAPVASGSASGGCDRGRRDSIR